MPGYKSLRKTVSSEKGILLPLLAVTISSLLVLFIAVGVDTSRTRFAAIQLRGEIDSLCKQIAYEPMAYADAWDMFEEQLGQLELKYDAQISAARLIMPTMPGDGRFPEYWKPVDPDPPFGVVREQDPFFFINDIAHTSIADNFPRELWDNLFNAGNIVGCEVEAELGMFFAGFIAPLYGPSWDAGYRAIRTRSVFYRPVNAFADFSLYGGGEAERIRPALTIAVGTQMQTSIGDDRFIFHDTSWDPYNPLVTYMQTDPFDNIGPDYRVPPEKIPAQYSGDVYLESLSPFTSEHHRSEMLVACMNPPVLLRNLFLSSIVELAARHGQLRRMTEILHINSQTPVLDLPWNPMPPVQMVAFEEDLLERSYQHPYVFYPAGHMGQQMRSGVQAKSPASSGEDFHVVLNPFDVARNPPFEYSSILEHHILVASQLRICHHLYDTERKRVRRDGLGIVEWHIGLEGFFPEIYSFDNFRPDSNSWDIPCPWDNSECLIPSELLTAAELVYSLGTSQTCPITEDVMGSVHHPAAVVPGGHCDKPAEEDDLKSDFLGLLRYLLLAPNAGGDSPPAFKSPGLFPLNYDEATGGFHDLSFFTVSAYASSVNRQSHILIVVHTAPAEEVVSELEALVNAVEERPFTIIYIPVSFDYIGVIEPELDRLMRAFNAELRWKGQAAGGNQNIIIPITPFLPVYDPDYDPANPEHEPCNNEQSYCWPYEWQQGSMTEEDLLIDFWHYLLDDQKVDNIQRRAQFLFLNRILTFMLKL